MRGAAIAASIVDVIGETPLLDLARFAKGEPGRILAKLEYLNPGGSKKDRMAKAVLEGAVESGDLRPGQPVIELTSGSAGMGAAIVCAAQGRRFTAVMSEGNSPERAQMMRAVGADVVLVPQAPGGVPGRVTGSDLALVETRTRDLAAAQGAFRIDQFVRRQAAQAMEAVAQEIWAQADGKVTAFCDFVGSGGTFAGLARGFERLDPSIRGYVVEPAGAAVLAGRPVSKPAHLIQGGGYLEPDLPHLGGLNPAGYLEVGDQEAVDAARRLACEEGVLAGFSSGANAAAALQLLRGPERDGVVAVVMGDTGLKYLSTELWR